MNPSTKQTGKGHDLSGKRTILVKTCCHIRWLYWSAALIQRSGFKFKLCVLEQVH